MTRQAVEDLGRGLFILDADAPQKARLENVRTPGNPKKNLSVTTDRDIRASLGERLRQAREAKGMSAADVAKVLKFKECDIVALEEGRVDGFTPVYAVGYVRTYSDYLGEKALGANVAEAVSQFRDEHFKPADKVYTFPQQEEKRRVSRASMVIGSGILALGCFLIWQFVQGSAEFAQMSEQAGPGSYQATMYSETER
ncbi:MAG: helix-turn-helix domain-containing protein [Proteobacteria bacterium]|nr:helix-turn-helix domain-containing protein [Pseudomonadota bacterium]